MIPTSSRRIVHLSSVHGRYDTRIYLKMCRSLAAGGHEVSLVVADGRGDEALEGVQIYDVGKPRGRFNRMAGATRRVLHKALALDADLYHLHDPELLPAALKLKRRGKRVIFDAHEDLPKQLLSKPYLAPWLRLPVASVAAGVERFVTVRLDAIVAATPAIRDKFQALGARSVDVNNFPMLGELESAVAWTDKRREVCYVGGITAIRGIREVVAAMGLCRSEASLNLVGEFGGATLRSEVVSSPGWERVRELGFLSRQDVRDVLARSLAGIVTFLPEPNHIEAQPNKMFEYMSAGVPVIASNFPLWCDVIEGSECGICVDPLDPSAIAAAIDKLIDNPELAQRMGENGRRAVHERYNWSRELPKLLSLYESVLTEETALP